MHQQQHRRPPARGRAVQAIVTTALPSIRKDLGGGLDDREWTVSAYILTCAALGMFGAALGDRFGRRRLFVAGLAIFTAASAPAAFTFPYRARHR